MKIMKKQILIIALCLMTSVFIYGQKKSKSYSSSSSSSYGFDKSDWFISGSFGFKSTGTGGTNQNTFEIIPSVGYFVTDKIAIGGLLGYRKAATDQILFGVFGRYYTKPKSQFSLFGQAGISVVSESNGGGGGSATNFGFALKPGLNYFVSNRFSLEATFGAIGFESKSNGGTSNTDFEFGIDLTKIGFGLNYKL
jgi:opacity protein-like surface antigen